MGLNKVIETNFTTHNVCNRLFEAVIMTYGKI